MFVLAALLLASLSSDPAFTEGCKLYDELEYEQAIFRFQEVALRGDLTAEDKATALTWLGLSYAGSGNLEAAKRAFIDAARADATVPLPVEVSPSLAQLVDEAKAAAADSAPATTTTTTPAPVSPPPAAAEPSALLPGVGVATGATILVGGVVLAALSAVTYESAKDVSQFQADAQTQLDTANLELATAYVLIPAGLVVGGISAWFLTQSFTP